LARFFVAVALIATGGPIAQTDSVPDADAQAIRSVVEIAIVATKFVSFLSASR